MQRRLDLGASLVGAPRLLLLDEPTTGLDPRSRNELWVAIEELAASGTDVLLTTQYLDEADRLADTIAIIDHGKLVASGTGDELKAQFGRDVVDMRVKDDADLERAAEALGAEATIDADHSRVSLPVTSGADELVTAVQALGRRRHRRSTTSRCAVPRWTTCSSPSPVTPPTESTDSDADAPRTSQVMTAITSSAPTPPPGRRPRSPSPARTTRKLLRTPQVFGIAIVQSVVFLLMFRYILGGAIGVSGVTYVEFLVPGFVVSGLLFTGGGSSVAVAEDVASGLNDRLRSLPISDRAVLAGRADGRRRAHGARRAW